MNYQELRRTFEEQVAPSRPNEWDIEEALQELEALADGQQRLLLEAIAAVWPISHSLSFSFLKEGARLGDELDRHLLAEWLRRILHQYEEGGLIKARRYMAACDITELTEEQHASTGRLADCHGRLTAFARGIGAPEATLQSGGSAATDTETIFLPEELDHFPELKSNILLYKLLIALQVAFIRLGSLSLTRLNTMAALSGAGTGTGMTGAAARYFKSFRHPGLAQDIYQLIELYQAVRLLAADYPGLLRDTLELRRELCAGRFSAGDFARCPLDALLHSLLLPEAQVDKEVAPLLALFRNTAEGDPAALLAELYEHLEALGCAEDSFSFHPFMGRFQFEEAERAIGRRILENKKKFATALAEVIANHELLDGEGDEGNQAEQQADAATIRFSPGKNEDGGRKQASLALDNETIELPEELLALIDRIEADLGELPRGYVSAAFGLAGRGVAAGEGNKDEGKRSAEQFIPYDEWDYRRYGYRRNWCSLRERTLRGTKSDFVARTLERHRGVLLKIRRQFEMMRTQERFARRRRHGDDLDLDALIDSLGDQAAGLAPSEKLFIRLIRDERSIATLFLVDMSNSTEGWIGVAIKEALVLLCEAMEVVGDRYGIYGFSGMRRMRSEVYGIKDITESYTDEVKRRIAAITPKEYTRMGPPIRHMINHFGKMDAKSRLLLILSDGKPEDYDDYKGRYAIEDTRRALAEARGRGIHPYCITIDRQAHDYLEHLFGRGNYTYVKDIEQLPSRLTEIYRLLTR